MLIRKGVLFVVLRDDTAHFYDKRILNVKTQKKVAFTGSTYIGQVLRRATAGTGKKLSLELGGKSPVIIFDDVDLDAAVEGVVDAIWFNQGQVCSAGSRLLIQETIFDQAIEKIKLRLKSFRVGSSLDKAVDMAALVDESQSTTIEEYLQSARDEGADIFQPDIEVCKIF